LGQILQWPRFTQLRDTSEVILAHANETYALIDKMLAAATAGGPCRRIHIGMDEVMFLRNNVICSNIYNVFITSLLVLEKDDTDYCLVIWTLNESLLITLNVWQECAEPKE
jgi:hypothetical protein